MIPFHEARPVDPTMSAFRERKGLPLRLTLGAKLPFQNK
jgi:hypothetical protein